MDIRHIKRFLALSDLGSFSKASEYLAISQPSLTREIQKMESDIGNKLFVRLPSGVELTPTGHIYKKSFQKVVNELERAQLASQSLGQALHGKVCIALHPIIAQNITPLMEQSLLREQAIEVDYHFIPSSEAIKEVSEFRSDFAIVASTFRHKDIKRIKLWSENITLYSASGHDETTILANPQMLNAEKIIKKYKKHRVRWINDYGVLLRTLESNSVMGLLPNTVAQHNHKLKALQSFQPTFDISLIFRTDLEMTSLHRWIINELKNLSRAL